MSFYLLAKHAYVCIYECICVCVYIYIYMYMYICVCVCVCERERLCVCLCVYLCKVFKYGSSLLSIFNYLLNAKSLFLCIQIFAWDTDFY